MSRVVKKQLIPKYYQTGRSIIDKNITYIMKNRIVSVPIVNDLSCVKTLLCILTHVTWCTKLIRIEMSSFSQIGSMSETAFLCYSLEFFTQL